MRVEQSDGTPDCFTLWVRILVVDDLPDTREVMRLLLEMKGHVVLEASNGKEGVERAVADHPDLILMDLSMPVMDGLTAARRIREQDAVTPIVGLSAYMKDCQWRDRALAAGCNYCCAKPLDFESLDRLLSVV